MNNNKGFTLIELMAVVSIVSILAVVSMATYSDYVVRSKVGEGMVFASEAKTSVTDYYYNMQKLPTNNSQAGLPEPESYDQYNFIRKLEVSSTEPFGAITITFKIPGTNADSKELQLIPSTKDGLMTWTCLPPEENGIDNNQVPPNCRG
ncbi:Fimbrial protein [Halioglobus japonicus]|nr:Fimbrial protein [Halioglobus japonicus]